MGAREGRYGCTRGPIMGFEPRAISARVLLVLVKHVISNNIIQKCLVYGETF